MPIPEPEDFGGGRYFKMSSLKKAPARFTIVSEIISGWEGWVDNSKSPLRSQTKDGFPKDTKWRKEKEGFKEGPKQWWAWLAFDWTDNGALKIYMPTQVSIIKAMKVLEADNDWGELPAAGYTLKITRSDEDGKTSYSVTPAPAIKPTAEQAAELQALLDTWTGLGALYTNEDPFKEFNEIPF